MINIKSIYKSNTLTLVRAFFALCFLSTLVFTPIKDLFPLNHIHTIKQNIQGLNHLNLFLWFDNILIPYYISVISLMLVIFGVYPRFTSIIQSWISYSVFYTMLIVEGGDQINIIITFLLIPICILDNRRNGWEINTSIKICHNKVLQYNANIALYFIKIQIALLYLNASVSKIFATEWSNGTAVYYWFNDPTFGAPKWLNNSIGVFFQNDYTVTFINWSVIFLELSLFVGIFLKQKYKYILFTLGFVFHFTIVIVHGLPTFWLSMSACLMLYFLKLDKTINENIKLIRINILKFIKNEK